MGSEAVYIPEFDLLACPFINRCKLPKIDFLCRIPECKTCPDYFSNVNKLRYIL
ncbi:MAG: hypothetical protein ACFFB0_20155 [Promethearchaeota archaeon]